MSNTRNIALIVIGCNYSRSKYALKGCINDAMDFAKTIVDQADNNHLNVNLKLLLDDSSGQNIRKYGISVFSGKNFACRVEEPSDKTEYPVYNQKSGFVISTPSGS